MALSADLSTRLDAGAIVEGLLSALAEAAGPVAELAGIDLPFDPAQLAEAVEAAEGVDASGIADAVGRVVEQAGPLLEQLPGIGDILGPITATLELVEQVTAGDLSADVGDLLERLGEQLEAPTDDRVVALLMQVAEALRAAPQGQTLVQVALRLFGAAGRTTPAPVRAAADLLPALDGAVRVLGALLTLESLLYESQRITGIMAGQLDAGQVRRALDALLRCFGDGELRRRVQLVHPLDVAEVRGVTAAIAACADQLDVLRDRVAAGMAFGEASLTYLGVDQVQRELEGAAQTLREADLGPLDRLLDQATGGIAGLLDADFSLAPADGLDRLLATVEARVADVAADIRALDPTVFTEPLADGVGFLTGLLDRLGELMAEITARVRGALEQVRDVVTALPLDDLAEAIRAVLGPVADALRTIGDLVDEVQAALDAAARAAVGAMEQVEGLVDGFAAEVQDLFDEARAFVEQLDLGAVVGQVSGAIQELADLIAKAQLKPYFDTANGAIGTAADVVEKVPFGLLPESMKADVDAAVRPIKEVDARAVERTVEDLLGVEQGGGFALRDEIEAALADIQRAYEELLAVVDEHDPRQYVQQLDAKLDEIADRIRGLSPDLSLQPVQDAIDQVKAVVGGFDLAAELQPVREVFGDVVEAIEAYSPAALIEPVQTRVDAAREAVKDALELEAWRPTLDELSERALSWLDALDPAQLEPRLREALDEVQRLVEALPDVGFGRWIGGLVAAMLAGTSDRVFADRFDAVRDWIAGASGSLALNRRAGAIADAVDRTRDAVRAVDLPSLSARLSLQADALRPAAQALADALPPGSPEQVALQTAIDRLDVQAAFGGLSANRDRYLALLDQAAGFAQTLRRTGLSEVDVAVGGLRDALDPVSRLAEILRRLLRALGLQGVEDGIPGVLRGLLAVAPPERLVGMVTPLFEAVHERVRVLLDAVLAPLRDAIDSLSDVIDQIDLTPLVEAVEGVHQAVLDEVSALDPDVVLGEVLDAFADTQQDVLEFDPLGPILAALDAVQETSARVLEKLHAEALLEDPLAIFDHVLGELQKLNVENLLDPVLDQLDVIARQVDEGLDETVTAFERLQAALPGGGGGSTASGAVSVGGSIGVGG